MKKPKSGCFYIVERKDNLFSVKEIWGKDVQYKFSTKERIKKFIRVLRLKGAQVGFTEREDWQAVYN